MSLFKKIADFCRADNEKAERQNKAMRAARVDYNLREYELKEMREKSKHCCFNCIWYCYLDSHCGKYHIEIDNSKDSNSCSGYDNKY